MGGTKLKNKKNRKAAVLIITILILSLSLGMVVFADNNFKNLKAWFGNISIYRNNQLVQLGDDKRPFIVDGTTYVPVRAMADLFNKEVGWDGINYRIDLNDKPSENLAYMSQQLYAAQLEIQALEAKVAQLEEELADRKSGKIGSLKDLKSYLNKQYGTYKKVKFDIDLYENKKDIEVDIYVDLYYYDYEWDDLTDSNIRKYIQNIVSDILDDYKDTDIEGSIMDSSTSKNKTLVSFYTKSNGTVVIDTDYRDDSDKYDSLYDLEDDLNWYYDEYEGVSFVIELYGDRDDIRVYITASKYDLDYLRERDIKKYLEEIYDEIVGVFPRAYVDGYIEDNYTEYYFDFDSRGNLYLELLR